MSDARGGEEGPGRGGALRAWLGWWIALALLWLALVDRPPWDELTLGVLAAAIGATAAVVVRRERLVLGRPRLWLLGAARGPLVWLVTDLPALARVLWRRGILRRPETGRIVELPFRASTSSPEGVTRRVAVQGLGSLAPGVIVIDVDADRDVLLVHVIEDRPGLIDRADPVGDR